MTCGCPIAAGDGHDFPRLIDEGVPGVAAVIDDVVEGFENSVRQPVLPHELPDIFLAVEFGCAWRELQERDVVWNLEGLGAMPPGLIEEENSVSARSDFGCDLIEVKLHSFGVAGRQHEGGAGSAFGADPQNYSRFFRRSRQRNRQRSNSQRQIASSSCLRTRSPSCEPCWRICGNGKRTCSATATTGAPPSRTPSACYHRPPHQGAPPAQPMQPEQTPAETSRFSEQQPPSSRLRRAWRWMRATG